MPAQFHDGKLLFIGGKVAMHGDCCCNVDCENCDGFAPDQVQVIIGGVAGTCPGTALCATAFNNTYILGPYLNEPLCTFQLPTIWSCDVTYVRATISATAITVTMRGLGSILLAKFQGSWTKGDCLAIGNPTPLDLPYVSDSLACDLSSATCTIEAL